MLSAGPRAALGLGSPGDRRIERGDPFTVAYGIRGALTCRAGFVAADEADLPQTSATTSTKLAAPYFACVADWYETVGIGVTGGETRRAGQSAISATRSSASGSIRATSSISTNG